MIINGILEQSGLQAVKARFERLYERRGPDECWLWWSGRDKPHSYPTFPIQVNLPKRVLLKGHMVSFALYNGISSTDDAIEHRHTCDNRLCVNPSHIVLGTRQDNAHDMYLRGRAPFGERNGNAVLNESQVLQIRDDPRRQVDIAEQYGISQASVSFIKSRTNWPYL